MIDVPEVWGTFLSRPTNRIGKQARLLIGEVVRPKVVIPIAVWVTVVGPSSVRPKEQKGEKDYRENSQHFALAMVLRSEWDFGDGSKLISPSSIIG